MSEYLARLESALVKAHQAGNTDHASKLAQAVRAERAKGTQSAPAAQPVDDMAFDPTDAPIRIGVPGTDVGFDVNVPQGATDFAIGVGKGMTDVGRGAQDLWARVTGNDDALARLTKRAGDEDAMFERDLGDSGWATAGTIVGEVAATAPIGLGLAGGAAKLGGSMVARTGTLAATEGALAEGLTQRGGAAERGVAATQGAALGFAGDKLLKFASNRVGAHVGRKAGQLDEASKLRALQAETDGGYRLSSAQSSQNTDALYTGKALSRENESFADFMQGQDSAIIDRANTFLDKMGGRDMAAGKNAQDARAAAAEAMATGLQKLRHADEAEVNKFYGEWRAKAGDEPIPVIGMREAGEAPLAAMSVAAEKAVGDDVRKVLNKYFVDDLNAGSKILGPNGKPMPAQETGLTVGNLEKLMQEFNELYRDTTSGAGRRAIQSVKDSLNEHVSLSFQKISDEGTGTLNAGRKATERFKEYLTDWDPKSVVTKLTEEGPEGITFRTNPMTSLKAVMGRGKTDQMNIMKRRMALSSDPEVREAWQRMQQVPLLEAIQAGMRTGGTDAISEGFSVKRFRSVLENYGDEDLKVLWGADMYDGVSRSMKAWELKDVSSNMMKQGAKQNPSGTALVMHNAASAGIRIAASTPMVGPYILAIPAAVRAITGAARKVSGDMDAKRMMNGKLPVEVERALRKAAKTAFTDDMLGEYSDAINVFLRAAAAEAMDGKDDNASTM